MLDTLTVTWSENPLLRMESESSIQCSKEPAMEHYRNAG